MENSNSTTTRNAFWNFNWRFLVMTFIFVFTQSNFTSAQTLWGKLYDNYSLKSDKKGDYSSHVNGYIVTGHSQTTFNKQMAYLLETDQMGNISLQNYLGDPDYNFYGESVIETSNGKYVVVGKTDKYQLYYGIYGIDCEDSIPYYNAFIAYIDPDSSAANWYSILGHRYLNDEGIAVIEDFNGDFVMTGIAKGYLSNMDTCILNDSLYVSPSGYDKSGILLAKFDKFGNVLFNKVFENDYFDQGVSLIDVPQTSEYLILANRRDALQTSNTRPIILKTDQNGNLFSAMDYDPFATINRIGQDLVIDGDSIIVIGNEIDLPFNLKTSFIFEIDLNLILITYSTIIHPYEELFYKDIHIDNDTFVISGNAQRAVGEGNVNTKFLVKMDFDPLHNFKFVELSFNRNITHYTSYGEEDNTNFCIYPYFDSEGWSHTGYHLFGNSQNYYIDHVKTDHHTISACWEQDSINEKDTIIPSLFVWNNEDTLSIFNDFDLYDSEFFLYHKCDSISSGESPFTASSEEQKHNSKFLLFPNPAQDILNIEISNIEEVHSVSIFNSIGVNIQNYSPTLIEDGRLILKINDWSPGVYYINIKSKSNNYTGKILKK